MSTSPEETEAPLGRGRTPKISLDLSNAVSHGNTHHVPADTNLLVPVTSTINSNHREASNNAIYSRRSLSRVTSRSAAAGSRSKSRKRYAATDNSDSGSYVTTSRSCSRSRSRSLHDSNLRADLKFSILNKNPYTERIRIGKSLDDESFDSDAESYNDSAAGYDSDDGSDFSETESISSVDTDAPSLLIAEQKKKNRKMDHHDHGETVYSSDEEKIMDVDENMFKNRLTYDFTSLVMPNTDISFSDVIENCKQWIELYKKDNNNQLEQSLLDSIDHKTFCNETCEKLTLVLGNQDSKTDKAVAHPVFHASLATSELPKTYILQSDLSMEAITYTITTLLKPGDQLYIIHTLEQAPLLKLTQALISITHRVLASFDQLNTNLSLDDVLVNVTVLRHHYPKHFLNGMIYALRPTLVVVTMSILKGWLNGFVCGVPLLVYKRQQRKRA